MNLKLEIKKLTEKIKWLKRQVDTIRQRKLSQSQELQKANEGMGENEVQITGRTSNGIIPVKCKKTYDLLSQSQRLPKANERMDENEVQITSRTSNGMIPVKCKKAYDLNKEGSSTLIKKGHLQREENESRKIETTKENSFWMGHCWFLASGRNKRASLKLPEL